MKAPVGRVYVLSNEAMPGLLKIGYTMNTVEGRAKELSIATGVPIEFAIEYQIECREPAVVESLTHAAFKDSRYNNSREFFSVSVESAVETIRRHAKEILDEELSASARLKMNSSPKPEDYRANRDEIGDWLEVHNLYGRTFVSRVNFIRDEYGMTIWQMWSVNFNKKMRDWQSVVSRRRYYFIDQCSESLYDCHYSLPMGGGDVISEIFQAEAERVPIEPGGPSEAIVLATRNWS